jgi:flavin reductase (DIM6/NTAB) family NADH-FMN oxidoreductase RutF
MHSLDPTEMEPRAAYRLMLSIVAPRPIAWVSTLSKTGVLNLAPYSFFNGVSGSPPIVMFSVSQKSARLGGGEKDTLRNVRETGEFVVNIVTEALAEAMNQTSGEWPSDVDEFAQAGLTAIQSTDVWPPRVGEAPIALEARLHQIMPVVDTTNTLVLGRIVRYHVRTDLLRDDGLVDAARLQPVMRLGGSEYATLGDVFTMQRPRV